MYFKSKNISLLLLGLMSIVVARGLFFFVNDPEGPNLLVVGVTALIIYALSFGFLKLYSFLFAR